MSDAVVITGLGLVGPFGLGSEALRDALEEGLPLTRPVDRSQGYHRRDSARTAGLVDQSLLTEWLDPKVSRRMSLPSKLAVAAGRMALHGAGFERGALKGRNAAVTLGTAFGPTAFSVRILEQVRKSGPESVSPFLFMESVANVHAGQVALDHGLVGPNATLTQREAGALLAVAQTKAYLDAGAVDLGLAGGTEEIATMAHAVLDRFGALARGGSGEGEIPRPFDRRRDGFIASEGAVIAVLETAVGARERGACIQAVVRGCVRASDPTATAQNWGCDASGLARSLGDGLARAGIALESIDRVVSGASGARRGDMVEAGVLRELFGRDLPPILVPKAVTGEYGAGLLGAGLLAVSDAGRWPCGGFETVDPECGLRPHDGRALPPARRVLVSALSAGGSACWLVLDAPGPVAEGEGAGA